MPYHAFAGMPSAVSRPNGRLVGQLRRLRAHRTIKRRHSEEDTGRY